MVARAWLEQRLLAAWQLRGWFAWLLSPLSALNYLIYRTRNRRDSPSPATRLAVPVVVVGNLYVGGTGKTPLTIELVRALTARGRRPGVVSRGHGRSAVAVRVIQRADPAELAGDEPLLIARSTEAPVAVGRNRVNAARALLARHPELDCIISDDGLQHSALERDVEIALLDERGLGNGWLLPAGPLREPPQRLRSVDAIVLHGCEPGATDSITGSNTPRFAMRSRLVAAWQLQDASHRCELSALAAEQGERKLRLLAAAGIGVPGRFFCMLRNARLTIDELALPDHFSFSADTFAGRNADRILVTEKDAVKCAAVPTLVRDPRIWVVPLVTSLDPALIDFIVARIGRANRETAFGSAPA